MKLHLDKYVNPNPNWKDLIGKYIKDADVIIYEKWQSPLETTAIGYSHFRCKTYQYGQAKAVLILDENEYVLDVFIYDVGLDQPDNTHTWQII
jgi:hypothetical protein